MVEVGMGQHHGVDRLRWNGERLPVAFTDVAATLEHPAVDKDFLIINSDKIFRAGHCPGRAMKSKLYQLSQAFRFNYKYCLSYVERSAKAMEIGFAGGLVEKVYIFAKRFTQNHRASQSVIPCLDTGPRNQ